MRMTATKSRLGHAEPAAGAVGIANLMMMLGQATTHAVSSLRHVSLAPYSKQLAC